MGGSFLDLNLDEFDGTLQAEPVEEISQKELVLANPNDLLLRYSFSTIQKATVGFLLARKPEKVSKKSLENFVLAIFQEYKFVPYHNFAHGVSVMQFFNTFVESLPNSEKLFDKNHVFVSLIAALSHDVGHQGKNNAYNCAKKTKIAIKSLNKAVLERFHIKKTLYLLRRHENDLFSEFNESERMLATQLITEAILATDMAELFCLLERFNKTKAADFAKNDNFLTGFVVHAADLGNLGLEFDNYISWAKLITQEFQTQTECEKRNQLKQSEFMKFKGKNSFVKDQLFFASFLIRHFCAAFVSKY